MRYAVLRRLGLGLLLGLVLVLLVLNALAFTGALADEKSEPAQPVVRAESGY
jgi:hypothetical protein